jgi:tRNA 2-selenouridine synthase
MLQIVSPIDFLNSSSVLLDTRSPSEHVQGHIPNAISFPLFSDEERAQVGICYKQEGPEAAVELGLTIVSPKMVDFVKTAKQLVPERVVRLHCWRGGIWHGYSKPQASK